MKKPVQKNNPAGQTLHIDQPISRSAKRRMRRRLNSLEARKSGYGLIRKSSNELDIAMMQVFVHTFERSMSQGCSEDTAKKVAQYSAETYVAKGGPGSGCNGDNCGRPKGGDTVHRAENRTDLKIGSSVKINDGHGGNGKIVAFHPNHVVEIQRSNGVNEKFHSSKLLLDEGQKKNLSAHTDEELKQKHADITSSILESKPGSTRQALNRDLKAVTDEVARRNQPKKETDSGKKSNVVHNESFQGHNIKVYQNNKGTFEAAYKTPGSKVTNRANPEKTKELAVEMARNHLRDYPAKVKKSGTIEDVYVPIIKANSEKQIIYGVVLTPDEEDTQEDVISADEIEKTAHAYMLNSRVVGSGHTKTIKARPVESYIAPMDMTFESGLYGTQKVKKGAWVLGVKVDDPKEWEKVSEGHYTGYSIGGVGIRD